MKFKKSKDGATVDIKGMPTDLLALLQQVTFDIGNGDCIFRYDTRLYSKWARPTEDTRLALKAFNDSIPNALQPWESEWLDRFEAVNKPDFEAWVTR